MDIVIERNAFGRQNDSFEADLKIDMLGKGAFNGVFIRAPAVAETGKNVEVIARHANKIVAVKQNNIIGTAFHPELAGDVRMHSHFVKMVMEYGEELTAGNPRHASIITPRCLVFGDYVARRLSGVPHARHEEVDGVAVSGGVRFVADLQPGDREPVLEREHQPNSAGGQHADMRAREEQVLDGRTYRMGAITNDAAAAEARTAVARSMVSRALLPGVLPPVSDCRQDGLRT